MEVSDFTVFAGFAAILAVLLVGGTIAAAPIRRKMLVISNELYDEPRASDRLKKRIDFFLDSAASPLIAPLMIVAGVATIIDAVFFRDSDVQPEVFHDDSRYMTLSGLYLASICLANPIVAVFMVPFILLCAVIHSGVKSFKSAALAEAQIDRVAHSRLARA